jgi:hypothetical protein
MTAGKLTKKKEAELRVIADSTYSAILATAARVPKVAEES